MLPVSKKAFVGCCLYKNLRGNSRLFSTKFKQEKQDHIPVMCKEVLDALNPQDEHTILDMTFGGGGHSRAILERNKNCKVIGLDRDPLAYNNALNMQKEYGLDRLVAVLGKFSELNEILPQLGIQPGTLDGALMDAGCSSMQLDRGERGFSFLRDGPLDMRMDAERFPDSATAADVVNTLDANQLFEILEKYGEEKRARKIAEQIVRYRIANGPLLTTGNLVEAVTSSFDEKVLKSHHDALNRNVHIATKTFMAIRIFVNDELNEISKGIDTVEHFIKRDGRLACLSFHSLEDRIVKRKMFGLNLDTPKNMSIREKARNKGEIQPPNKKTCNWVPFQKDVLIPEYNEVKNNSRSRSAKLRVAIRI